MDLYYIRQIASSLKVTPAQYTHTIMPSRSCQTCTTHIRPIYSITHLHTPPSTLHIKIQNARDDSLVHSTLLNVQIFNVIRKYDRVESIEQIAERGGMSERERQRARTTCYKL